MHLLFRQESEDYDVIVQMRRCIRACPKVDFRSLRLNLKMTTFKEKNLTFRRNIA